MALFSFNVPAQYFNVSHDILRMVCIQVVVQFLFNVVHPKENPLALFSYKPFLCADRCCILLVSGSLFCSIHCRR